MPWRLPGHVALADHRSRRSEAAKCPVSGCGLDSLAHDVLAHIDRKILDLERTWFLIPGTKERAIVDELGMDAASYYRRLRDLLEEREAVSYDPLTVLRLRRWIGAT